MCNSYMMGDISQHKDDKLSVRHLQNVCDMIKCMMTLNRVCVCLGEWVSQEHSIQTSSGSKLPP